MRHATMDSGIEPTRSIDEQLAGTMFAKTFDVVVPRIYTPAPVAAGSTSSAAGARNVAPRRGSQIARILSALYPQPSPIAREHLTRLTGIKETSLCGRLAELVPIWVRCVPDVCTSDAGVHVNGYVITDAGRARVQEIK